MADMKSLTAIVIAFLVIGLVLGVGFLLLAEFEETLAPDSTAVENENVNVTTTGVYVANNDTTADTFCYNSFTVSSVRNHSDQAIESGNYSTEPATGKIWNVTSEYGDQGYGWWINYSYNAEDTPACEGLNETIDAVETIPTWFTIIIIVLIAGILLFLVFKVIPLMGTGGTAGTEGAIAQV